MIAVWSVPAAVLIAAAAAEAPPDEQPEPQDAPTFQTVVTGTRLPRPLRDVPATVIVIPREELEQTPALLLDGALRAVPSVGMFRRSNSLTADPSSQGLNLRGLGPSGVSRALVLLDGVPVNDPFGGWVYWRGLPKLGLERVEIAPGGSSALYGNYGLGGVVQLVSRPIRDDALDAEASVGEHDTFTAAARAAMRAGSVGAALEAEGLTTGGHYVVAPSDRGAIDRRAPSAHRAFNARVEYRPEAGATHVTARAGHFAEAQSGGTRFTTAEVQVTDAALRAYHRTEERGAFELTAFGRVQEFSQVRARIGEGRSSEARASEQRVPSDDQGLSLVWFAPAASLGGTHHVSVGADVRRIEGVSHQTLYPFSASPSALVARSSGGQQQYLGVFVEDLLSVTGAWEVSVALRADGWRNVDGFRRVLAASGDEEEVTFEERRAFALSPRVGVLHRLTPGWALRASAWRAFRAPTLNELYRPFQVGRIVTGANPALLPETVYGGEAGVELSASDAATVRLTGFWNELLDPVSNVTLPQRVEGMDRQRQNLGTARVRGVELSVDARLARRWVVLGSYTLVDPRVTSAPARPELVGKQLPQDPNHRGTLAVRYNDARLGAFTAQARWSGPQFEDDLNQRPMAGFVVVDVFASRSVVRGVDVFAAVENLFDREYLVGRAGVDTIGQPLTVRAGLRLAY